MTMENLQLHDNENKLPKSFCHIVKFEFTIPIMEQLIYIFFFTADGNYKQNK